MIRNIQKYSWIVLLSLFVTITASSQEFEDFCRELFDTAFAELGQNCAGLADNSACFGFGGVSTEFVDLSGNPIQLDDSTLLAEGDQTLLYDSENNRIIRSVETTAFNPLFDTSNNGVHIVQSGQNLFRISLLYGVDINEIASLNNIIDATQIFVGQEILIPGLYVEPDETSADEMASAPWGIASVYTDANLPQQLDSSGARIIIFGDTKLTDATPLDLIFVPGAIVNVSVSEAEIFTSPPDYPMASSVIQTVSGEFEADAISPDGQWVRVFYLFERNFGSRATAWLPVSALANAPDLSALPIMSANHASPMQHLLLEAGDSQGRCDNKNTTGIIIQGEDLIETDITINGQSIRMTSSLFVEFIPPSQVRIVALDGIIQLFPDADEPTTLVPGYSVTIEISDLPGVEGGTTSTVGDPILEESTIFEALSQVVQAVPDNLIEDIPPVTIVTSSGNGEAIDTLALDPEELARIVGYCQQGLLSADICSRLP